MYAIFGDSHARRFVGHGWGNFSYNFFSGATIQGLTSKSSVTGHAEIIRSVMSCSVKKTAVFLFGGVDLDFTYYRNFCREFAIDDESFIESRTASYTRFLNELLTEEARSNLAAVFVLAPHVSSLVGDDFYRITAAQARVEEERLRDCANYIDLSIGGRNKRIIEFNDRLEQSLQRVPGVEFVRIDKDMVDEDFATFSRFLPEKPDHHTRGPETMKLWKPKLTHHIPVFA